MYRDLNEGRKDVLRSSRTDVGQGRYKLSKLNRSDAMRRDAKQCACISRELLHWTYFTMRNWIEPNRFVKCSCIYAYVGMYAYTCTRTRIRKSRKNVIKYVIHAYYFKLSIECPNIKYIIARLNRVFSFFRYIHTCVYIYISFSLPLYLNSIRS